VRRGVWYGVAAYTLWGLFPLYWTMLEAVPAEQIISHRIVWSFLVLIPVAAVSLHRDAQRRARQPPLPGVPLLTVVNLWSVLPLYSAAAALIGLNWYLYIWGVNHGLVVGTSLGYFITPLVNVLLGVVILRESLRPLQWLAVAIATSGVLYLWWAYGTLPWIALALAGTFGTYGLVKKQAPMPPLYGLTVETGILFLPALAFLGILATGGTGAFGTAGTRTTLLLAGAGFVTTLPLLLFASAVQRVQLSVIGILQYISPTIQFLLGIFFYGEPFARHQMVGFGIVWMACAVFAAEGAWQGTGS
jgi:chloramphenicol-sensitive protein RarD